MTLETILIIGVLVCVGAYFHQQLLFTRAYADLINMLPHTPVPIVLFVSRVAQTRTKNIRSLIDAPSMRLNYRVWKLASRHQYTTDVAIAHRVIVRLVFEGVAECRNTSYTRDQLQSFIAHHGDHISKKARQELETLLKGDKEYFTLPTIRTPRGPSTRPPDPEGWGY